MSEPTPTSITYASAGVDVEAGDKAVELMKASVRRATRPEVLGGLGGFAGMFDASAIARMARPVLATSTDGVGTKVAIAQALDRHDTIGFDLVGMVVDDIVVCGAEPLFMTDYIATGKVVPERIAAIVSGIARACEQARVALVGGETAEHPGLLDPDEYDVAGAATGVVEYADVLGPQRVVAGDVVLGLASSGLHSNGYSARPPGRRARGLGARPPRRRVRPDPRRGAPRAHPGLLRRPARPRALRRRRRPLPLARDRRRPRGQPRARPPSARPRAARPRDVDPARRCSRRSARSAACRAPTSSAPSTWASGFVAVLPPTGVDAAVAHLAERGIDAWVMGEVHEAGAAPVEDGVEVVRGAKGVDGGAVQVVGEHPAA